MKVSGLLSSLNHLYSGCPEDPRCFHAATLSALLRRGWVTIRPDYLDRTCVWLTGAGEAKARAIWG
jgi:hypothetical protein